MCLLQKRNTILFYLEKNMRYDRDPLFIICTILRGNYSRPSWHPRHSKVLKALATNPDLNSVFCYTKRYLDLFRLDEYLLILYACRANNMIRARTEIRPLRQKQPSERSKNKPNVKEILQHPRKHLNFKRFAQN